MKKFLCVMAVVLLTTTVLFAAGQQTGGSASSAPAQAGTKVKWIFSATNAADNPSVVTARTMADRITARTNGNWTFEFYPAATLANEADTVEMTRTGTVHWIQTGATFMEVYLPEAGALGLPYLFRRWEDQRKFLRDSPFMTSKWKELETLTGLRYVDSLNLGARNLTTRGIKSVKSPADLRGAKIRSQQPQSRQNMVNALGATAVPMSLEEVYIAIQTGVIQGQENPIINIYLNKFYEVSDDLYKTEHSYGEGSYFVNGLAFDRLPEEYKAIWNEEWPVMMKEFEALTSKSEEEAEAAIRASGVRIWEQKDLNMQAFWDSAADMIQKNYMSNPVWTAVINAVNQYCGYK
jgi:tripartite ATP-independent transporter DctP family solute receptor